MNCEQANKISINDFLRKNHFNPVKRSGQNMFYYSPFRNENEPSFIVNKFNKWHDFGSGTHGNLIDFIRKWKNCSVKEALEFIKNNQSSFSFHEQEIVLDSEIKIRQIKSVVKHKALLDYLYSRAINPFEILKNELKEVWYTKNDKLFFGIGFKNNLGGYEMRSPVFKNCIGKKAITTIINNSDEIIVFEGFFDYLSYLVLNWNTTDTDYLILNSTSLYNQAIPIIRRYKTIKAYLDNDNAGIECLSKLENECNNIIDCSSKYRPYKDLNEFLIKTKNNE